MSTPNSKSFKMSLIPIGTVIDVKEIVDKHHQLIVRNINPSDELMEAMKHYKVVTDTMIQDIKDSADRHDKVSKILDLMAIKGSHVMELFCDALHLSGHAFIADFIRDEINDLVVKKKNTEDSSSNKFVDGRDIVQYMCGKFEGMVHDTEKADLMQYLERKFQAALIKKMAKLNNDDKQKAITAKQNQIEESLKFNDVLIEKDRDYQHMTDKLQKAIEESCSKGVELKGMYKNLQDLRDKYTEQLASQLKFNNANDSSLQRLAKRTNDMEHTCRQMMKMMEPYLPEPDENGMRRDSNSSSSIDRLVSDNDKCKHTLMLLLPRISSLIKMKEDYMSLCEDREYVLMQIGVANCNHQPHVLRQAFQDFVVDREATHQTLVKDNVQLKDALQSLQSQFLTTGSKLEEVQEKSDILQKIRERTFVKDMYHKDTELVALKADRDELRESHVMKDARIKILEANLAQAQQVARGKPRIDSDEREAHQSSMNETRKDKKIFDDGAPHPLASHLKSTTPQLPNNPRVPYNKTVSMLARSYGSGAVKPQPVKNLIDISPQTVLPTSLQGTVPGSSLGASPRESSPPKRGTHAGGTPAGVTPLGGTPAGGTPKQGNIDITSAQHWPNIGTNVDTGQNSKDHWPSVQGKVEPPIASVRGTPAGGTPAGGTPTVGSPRRGSLKYSSPNVETGQNAMHVKVEPSIAWPSTITGTEHSNSRKAVSPVKQPKTMVDPLQVHNNKQPTSTIQRKSKHD